MIPSSGRLRYDPRVVVDGREHFDPWWLVLECPPEVLEDGRERLLNERGVRLTRPRWGAHVSVVSGEEPPERSRWGAQDGVMVSFEYDPEAKTDGVFYWLEVVCDEALALREALGLPRAPRSPLHLTLGRRKG